jgi:AcrR family transcriptional regulator
MPPESTRERLLDAAEELFAHKGISATSLRALTRHAGVNLAAVHYHFGSKEGLLDAVVERRAKPINAVREQALREVLLGANGSPPSAEAILLAFFLPVLHGMRASGTEDGHHTLIRLMARIEAQPPDELEPLFRKHFGEICARTIDALHTALPELPVELVAERFRFAIGVLNHLFDGTLDLDAIPGHPPSPADSETRIHHAIQFALAGLQAPVRDEAGTAPKRSESDGDVAPPVTPRLEVNSQ